MASSNDGRLLGGFSCAGSVSWRTSAGSGGLAGALANSRILWRRGSRGLWQTSAESWQMRRGLAASGCSHCIAPTRSKRMLALHMRDMRAPGVTHCQCHAFPFSCRWQEAVQSAAMELHFQRGPNYAKPSLLAHYTYVRIMMHINIRHG